MRTPSWKRLAVAGLVAAAVPAAMLWVSARACGPDFEPEVFVTANHPEKPALFADGHLGILLSSYYHADLVVAYRLLSGGTLSDAEKSSYTNGTQDTAQGPEYGQGPPEDWLMNRAKALGQAANNIAYNNDIQQERSFKKTANGVTEVHFDLLNCADAAFLTAIDTMWQRKDLWGVNSPEFAEWLRGQDAVFSNCSKAGSMPDPAKPEWPPLLRQDRAYQIAAAKFYAGDYDGAIADFEAISKDKTSPWNVWGEYLAARAEVRKAASITEPAKFNQMATFDTDELQAAESRLLKVEKESQDTGIRNAAAAELGFVEVRLEPGKRLDQVAEALAGPKPDPQFNQDLADLDYLMDRGVTGDSDLARWIKEIQFSSPNPATGGGQTLNAMSLWQKQHTSPWLIAAMAQASPKNVASSELMSAAAAVPHSSPAYEAVSYYRAERLLDAGRKTDARTLLTAMLARMGPDTMQSTRNAFLSARMPTARNLAEFLADASRTMIESNSESAGIAQCSAQPSGDMPPPSGTGYCGPLQFDADAPGYLNTQMPLTLLEQAAESPALPDHLRKAVAEMAWVRAVALGDTAAVAGMAKLLPAPMHQTAGTSDGFPATLALLRAPGVRPFLDQGVQRSASFAELDHFGDNWWCGRWTDDSVAQGTQSYGPQPTVLPPLELLTPQQRQQAAAEATRINALPQGLVWVGQRAMAYVKAHPDDKNAPEALSLIVHGTRYGCATYNQPNAQKALSKDAFEMLHRMYPKSKWTLNTKYYY